MVEMRFIKSEKDCDMRGSCEQHRTEIGRCVYHPSKENGKYALACEGYKVSTGPRPGDGIDPELEMTRNLFR